MISAVPKIKENVYGNRPDWARLLNILGCSALLVSSYFCGFTQSIWFILSQGQTAKDKSQDMFSVKQSVCSVLSPQYWYIRI